MRAGSAMLRGMAPPDDSLPDPRGADGASPRRWSGRRLVAAIVGVTLVIAVAGTALAIATADSRADPIVPPDTASGPGTQLPDGLSVIAGSVLLGPVVVEELDADGRPETWHAVVMVDSGDPMGVWSRYVTQMVARSPSSDLDPDAAPGCVAAEDRSPGEPADVMRRTTRILRPGPATPHPSRSPPATARTSASRSRPRRSPMRTTTSAMCCGRA